MDHGQERPEYSQLKHSKIKAVTFQEHNNFTKIMHHMSLNN